MKIPEGPVDSAGCRRTHCNCNCCNKARDQHCGHHERDCHVGCRNS